MTCIISPQCQALSSEDLSLLSLLPLLNTLRIAGSIYGIHSDRTLHPPPSTSGRASINSAPEQQRALGDEDQVSVRHEGLPRLKHLHLVTDLRQGFFGVSVRKISWLLGPHARLMSLSPIPVLLNTDCGDFSDQAFTISCLLQLLAGPLLLCSSSLAFSGMLGFSAYNCGYMFHSLQVCLRHSLLSHKYSFILPMKTSPSFKIVLFIYLHESTCFSGWFHIHKCAT